jgi:glycosyltransferase involved in cell wall biosynthesis
MQTQTISPFFSIAIPAYGYNGKGVEFLQYNLDILIKQKFKNFEVIIADHSSDDTIKEVFNQYEFKQNLSIYYHRTNYGHGFTAPNLNNAIRNSNGKWIKVLFQDDFLFDENSLQFQYEKLKSNSNIKWLITTFCHSNDGINFYKLYKPFLSPNIWSGANTLGNLSNLTFVNNDVIYCDEQLNWLIDCDYYYKLFLKYGEPEILNEITVVNRTHGNGLSNTISTDIKMREFEMLKKRYA